MSISIKQMVLILVDVSLYITFRDKVHVSLITASDRMFDERTNRVSLSRMSCGSKVDSAFHPSEVDKMSTRNFWELSGKK